MLCRHKLAHTAPIDGREAVGAKARWSGDILALAAGLLAAGLSTSAALATDKVNVLYAGSLVWSPSVSPARAGKQASGPARKQEKARASSCATRHLRPDIDDSLFLHIVGSRSEAPET